MTLDHVGIAVRSIRESLAFYGDALGLKLVHEEEVPSQGVRVAFLGEGPATVELLEPIGEEGAVAKFVKQRGPGLHHAAFRDDDIEGRMAGLKAGGRPPLEDRPRPGARGHRVCFLHPRYCGGVLVELVGL